MESELIVREKIDAIELYTKKGMVDPLLEEITRKAKDFEPDLSTKKSRDEIASMAYKVRQSKTLLDGLGKDLVSDWKQKAKVVDNSRKHIRDYLDNLAEEVRKPLTEWEAEQKRIEEEKAALEQYLKDWDEAEQENALFDRKREIERKEAELALQEEERKAKEEAERLEKERIEREERLKKEAAEKARREAEEKAENERQELIRREAVAKSEKERVEREAKEAAERAEREKQKAIEAEQRKAKEEAARKERERLEAERVERERAEKEKAEAERKARHHAHRKKINNEALVDFEQNGLDSTVAKSIIEMIAKGLISHITINY